MTGRLLDTMTFFLCVCVRVEGHDLMDVSQRILVNACLLFCLNGS